MQPLKTQSSRMPPSRPYPYLSSLSSDRRPMKPQSSQLSSSRLNSLLALAMIMMLLGIAFGWGVVNIPVLLSRSVASASQHPSPTVLVHGRDVVSKQHDTTATDLNASPTEEVSASPTIDPYLLGLHMDTGWRLRVAAIGLNVPVETVNVDATGRLELPLRHQWNGAGWYQGGPRPGLLGSSVIDGYLKRSDGSPAVFDKLSYLHVGDQVEIIDQNGVTLHFHVMDVHTYEPDQAPISSIFGDNSGTYLNLVTNAGSWASTRQQPAQQIVVHTEMGS